MGDPPSRTAVSTPLAHCADKSDHCRVLWSQIGHGRHAHGDDQKEDQGDRVDHDVLPCGVRSPCCGMSSGDRASFAACTCSGLSEARQTTSRIAANAHGVGLTWLFNGHSRFIRVQSRRWRKVLVGVERTSFHVKSSRGSASHQCHLVMLRSTAIWPTVSPDMRYQVPETADRVFGRCISTCRSGDRTQMR
jgi:hypothetical protein